MGDHVVVQLDRLIKPETVDSTKENAHPESNPSVPSFSQVISGFDRDKEDHKVADEEEPLIQTVECRICQEEDQIKNLETPCACSGWTITGTPLDLHDPRLLAMAAAQRHLLEAEYDEYAATNASGAAFFRSAALIVSSYTVIGINRFHSIDYRV
ncbi:hypothetical protein B296_00009662 [Ensete ventricosum]|uniref:RING-CH-type domain-containing protein n=1 Tax=Ensete ventricosum TaxID=4639 RepID=A0A426ZIV6_ENSVE|nr:hypothetical protein B296_00009662 [Ensete ventricosum]